MWDEVLEDHLLDVPVALVRGGERRERPDPLVLALADPDQDPARERIRSSPAASIVSIRTAGCLVGDPCGRRVRRLEHQALRRGHLAQARQVLARQHAEVRVRQQAALQRPLAGPGDVGDEVVVAVLGQPPRDLGVDLGQLARQDEQLLGVPPHRLLEAVLHLLRRVEVRRVRRERAVLAVAPARARERERVVAAEGDPAHGSRR